MLVPIEALKYRRRLLEYPPRIFEKLLHFVGVMLPVRDGGLPNNLVRRQELADRKLFAQVSEY